MEFVGCSDFLSGTGSSSSYCLETHCSHEKYFQQPLNKKSASIKDQLCDVLIYECESKSMRVDNNTKTITSTTK